VAHYHNENTNFLDLIVSGISGFIWMIFWSLWIVWAR